MTRKIKITAEIKTSHEDFPGRGLLGPQASFKVIPCWQTQISTYPGRGYSGGPQASLKCSSVSRSNDL